MEQFKSAREDFNAAWQMALYADVAQTALAAASAPDFNPDMQVGRLREGLSAARQGPLGADPARFAEVVSQYELAIRSHSLGIPFVAVLESVAHYRASEGLEDYKRGNHDRAEEVASKDTYLLLAAGVLNDTMPTVRALPTE